MLFEPADMKADFAAATHVALEEMQVILAEGKRHTGLSSIVRLIARRP